jgi:hypothetical protein
VIHEGRGEVVVSERVAWGIGEVEKECRDTRYRTSKGDDGFSGEETLDVSAPGYPGWGGGFDRTAQGGFGRKLAGNEE